MDQPRTKDWRELCKEAANESHPRKLMELIAEITKALDERDGSRNGNARDNRQADLSARSGALPPTAGSRDGTMQRDKIQYGLKELTV